MLRKILVPLDGSLRAEQALTYGFALAEKFEAELNLIQVLVPQVVTASYYSLTSLNYHEDFPPTREKADAYLQALKERYGDSPVAICTYVLDCQPIAEAVRTWANDEAVDLIVMTTHGRSGLGRWIYGSVANAVLQHSPCPVFLVRAE